MTPKKKITCNYSKLLLMMESDQLVWVQLSSCGNATTFLEQEYVESKTLWWAVKWQTVSLSNWDGQQLGLVSITACHLDGINECHILFRTLKVWPDKPCPLLDILGISGCNPAAPRGSCNVISRKIWALPVCPGSHLNQLLGLREPRLISRQVY